jgi:hypothetical protein
MEPLLGSVNTATHSTTDGLNSHRPAAPHGPREGKVQVRGFEPNLSLIFADNPHLSFLLSRITAYRFSFQQRPYVVGPDVMASVLQKNPELPWFVAPIIVPSSDEWREEEAPVKITPIVERLAGYLTLDNGRCNRGEVKSAEGEPPPLTEKWSEFQNELLHEFELFSTCLAQRACFSELLFSPRHKK